MSSNTPLTVHHLNNSRSQRILWLLEELDVPYEVKRYERTPLKVAPKELIDVHPLGKSPVITDGGLVIAESGAIVEYIIEKYGNGRATPPVLGKLDDRYFTHYSEGTLMPLRVNSYVYTLIPDRLPLLIRPIGRMIFAQLQKTLIDPNLKANMDLVEAHLAKSGDFFAGGTEPTAADYMMSFPLEALASTHQIGPHISAFLKRIQERPAYIRALKRGGEYAYVKSKL